MNFREKAREIDPAGDLRIERAERKAVVAAMVRARGAKRLAAAILGIGKTTLYRKLDQHAIAASEYGTTVCPANRLGHVFRLNGRCQGCGLEAPAESRGAVSEGLDYIAPSAILRPSAEVASVGVAPHPMAREHHMVAHGDPEHVARCDQ